MICHFLWSLVKHKWVIINLCLDILAPVFSQSLMAFIFIKVCAFVCMRKLGVSVGYCLQVKMQ